MNEKTREYHKELLGDEFSLFEEWVEKPERKSIRLNPIRTTKEEFKDELASMGADPIPWCDMGFWVDGAGLGATIPHQLGYYYVQEAASMLPPVVLDPQKEDIILDLAAAPGSKTTQIAPYCDTIIANEPDYQRRRALVSNSERCGIMNIVVTGYDGRRFPYMEFDRILVDAPCSNVGSARKNHTVLKTWTPKFAKSISKLQKKLLTSAFELLKPGGTLVYSTCTSSTEENEEVVLDLMENSEAKLEKINMKGNYHKGLLGADKCVRLYPWDNDTEFFFVAKITK